MEKFDTTQQFVLQEYLRNKFSFLKIGKSKRKKLTEALRWFLPLGATFDILMISSTSSNITTR